MTKTFPTEMLAQHLAVVGKTGAGKTFAAKGFVEHLLTEKRRVCILDPTGVWWGLRSSSDGTKAGFAVAVFGGPHADVPIAESSGAALAHLVATKNLPAIIDLSDMLIGQRHRFVTEFAEALYRENKAALHLVVDEADEFMPQNPLPETKRMLHHMDRIVRRGRARGFRVWLITQRPAVLHKNAITQANTLVAMRLTAPQDRMAIKAWIDGTGNPQHGKMVLDSLAKLQRGEGWVWAPELEYLHRVPFPAITTFDSSRSPEDGEEVAEPTALAAVDLTEIRKSLEVEAPEPKAARHDGEEFAKLHLELRGLRDELRVTQAQLAHARSIVTQIQRLVDGAIEVGETVTFPLDGGGRSDIPVAEIQRKNIEFFHGRQAQPKAAGPALIVAGVNVTAPMQRILDVLRQLEQFGISPAERPMIAAHAGVSPTSGGFFNNLGRLRTMGMIDYPSGGVVALTDGGRQIANPPSKAMTINDLHQSWIDAVTAPQANILREAIALWPDPIDRDSLAKRIGVSPTSGGFFNNLGRLRTLGAIDYPAKGMVMASQLLFPKGIGR